MRDAHRWKRFARWLAGTFAGTLGVCAVLILVANPYRNIPFAPPGDRPMMDINQRWMYPALARDPRIDSAVFGTSTIRLLEPARLQERFGGAFAQLAMNSGTAWEQARMMDLFLRHHPAPRTVVVGIDGAWCGTRAAERITARGFPEWMYDEDPWNDLAYLMNGQTVEIAGRMAAHALGLQEPRYDARGWANFLPDDSAYDLARARAHIYGRAEPWRHPPPSAPAPPATERAGWDYVDHPMLEALLARLPATTTAILVLVPYHGHELGHPESGKRAGLDECKARLTAMAGRLGTVHVVDFMIPSPITETDENYWDHQHYTLAVARRLVDLMADAVRTGVDAPGLHILARPRPAP